MHPTTYRTVATPTVARVEDRRSVFECWLRRAGDEDAARAVVEEARATHWNARHHCSAFVVGPDRALTRSNDDGEPAGTAGMPMLESLLGSGLSDVVAVVTRWFGGTLLGTGGLVRAYSQAVREAVTAAPVLTRELRRLVSLRVDHAGAGRVEHELRALGVHVADTRYGTAVELDLAVPVGDADELQQTLARISGGQAEPVWGDEVWVDLGGAG
jgi:uncharacterized YigZ family protein